MPKLLTYRGDRGSKFSTKSLGNCYTSCITCAYMMFSIELWGFFFTRKHGNICKRLAFSRVWIREIFCKVGVKTWKCEYFEQGKSGQFLSRSKSTHIFLHSIFKLVLCKIRLLKQVPQNDKLQRNIIYAINKWRTCYFCRNYRNTYIINERSLLKFARTSTWQNLISTWFSFDQFIDRSKFSVT